MANTAILASFAWQILHSLAAPTPDTTATATTTTTTTVADPGWKQEPKGRGTFSIILTSILTLCLCVWTAIHPNVRPNATPWKKMRARLRLVLVGMLAPEIVLAIAFYDWYRAKIFHGEWCKRYKIVPNGKDTLRMKGAFFVTMGGVSIAPASLGVPPAVRSIFSTSSYLELTRTKVGWQEMQEAAVAEATKIAEVVGQVGPDRPEPDNQGEGGWERPTASPVPPATAERKKPHEQVEREEGVVNVEKEGEEINIEKEGEVEGAEEAGGAEEAEEEELDDAAMIIQKRFVHWRDVEDKGKAEMLGKTLVCVQALWMLVQCAVRKASGLPVTLLEIHVAMHVICTIGMYVFWFNKPQDVGEPLALGISTDERQLHLEVVNQQTSYMDHLVRVRVDGRLDVRPSVLRDQDDLAEPASTYTRIPPSPTTRSVRFLWREIREQEHTTNIIPDHDPTCLLVPVDHVLDLGPVRIYNDLGKSYRGMGKDGVTMTCEVLELFARAADAHKAGKRPKLPLVGLLQRVSNRRVSDIIFDIDINVYPGIFVLLLYGACHAAAWNTHFPSHVECLLWRISSVVIAVIPAYFLFLWAPYGLDGKGRNTPYRVLTLCTKDIYRWCRHRHIPCVFGKWVARLVVRLLIILVLCGRVYLLAESFLSLRSLPHGAFDSTPWEDYFPHF